MKLMNKNIRHNMCLIAFMFFSNTHRCTAAEKQTKAQIKKNRIAWLAEALEIKDTDTAHTLQDSRDVQTESKQHSESTLSEMEQKLLAAKNQAEEQKNESLLSTLEYHLSCMKTIKLSR
jgi:hypothetical protein